MYGKGKQRPSSTGIGVCIAFSLALVRRLHEHLLAYRDHFIFKPIHAFVVLLSQTPHSTFTSLCTWRFVTITGQPLDGIS